MFTKQRIVLLKEESVYNQDPTPTPAANAIEAIGTKVSYPGEQLERDQERNHLSPLTPLQGKYYVEVTFSVNVKGSGTRGVAPRIGDALEACAFSESIGSTGGSSSVVYKPSSNSIKSVTLYVYDYDGAGNAKLNKITGARGNMKLSLVAGQPAKMDFTFRGLYNAPSDVGGEPTVPTYESTGELKVESSQFTLNAVSTLVVQQFEVDMGNKIEIQEDINSAAGVKAVLITGRRPSGSFNPEAVLVATYGFYADFIAATARALSASLGSVAGNQLAISAPKVTLGNIGEGDKSGIRTNDIPIALSGNAGNDELVLTFS